MFKHTDFELIRKACAHFHDACYDVTKIPRVISDIISEYIDIANIIRPRVIKLNNKCQNPGCNNPGEPIYRDYQWCNNCIMKRYGLIDTFCFTNSSEVNNARSSNVPIDYDDNVLAWKKIGNDKSMLSIHVMDKLARCSIMREYGDSSYNIPYHVIIGVLFGDCIYPLEEKEVHSGGIGFYYGFILIKSDPTMGGYYVYGEVGKALKGIINHLRTHGIHLHHTYNAFMQ